MTELDVKSLGDLMKSVGPTDEHRKEFGETFLGSLLGQATVCVGLVLVYVVCIVLLWKYIFDEGRALREPAGAVAFWTFFATPLVVILLFSMLPTAWRGLRERRLKASVIGGDPQFKPGYFRLYPYDETDRETFKRLDGADARILKWLRSTKASLLYLSGASGVGKSSLLAADILPQLRDAGWLVIETRLFGDPMDRLRSAVVAVANRSTRKFAADLSLRDLLAGLAARTKKGAEPVLIVIDQFEEFLILNREEERVGFAGFLRDLLERPIEGLRLLLVFRSDYRPLVFKLDLPPPAPGQNWQEIAPYDRGEATVFLQSGGRELSEEAIDKLFRGLDRIEDARGLYRPITLNMVGLVLERMGRKLEGDPGQLIQSYLIGCLTAGSSRDFAKPLLQQLITDAGTKEPRSEADLVARTGFELWQVKATLAELARQGLVRRLEAATHVWEISHDFLARLIGQLIGRLKPSVLRLARPLVAPAVLLGWIALAVLALPPWLQWSSEQALRKLGASLGEASSGGLTVSLPQSLDLAEARAYLLRVNVSELIGRLKSLEPLGEMTTLKSLHVYDASRITSLAPLKGLTNLRELHLSGATGITCLEPLKGLTNLSGLDLSGATGITSLESLKGLADLRRLDLSGAPGITSLEPLKGLTNLRELHLSGATGITSLQPLKGMRVYIDGAPRGLRLAADADE